MKRTLYPKLLAGYLMYGVIGCLIIVTFTYHVTFNFLEKREASSLYRESALISTNYAGNYFNRTMELSELTTQLTTLSTYLSGEIWIVDTHGNIIINTSRPELAEIRNPSKDSTSRISGTVITRSELSTTVFPQIP